MGRYCILCGSMSKKTTEKISYYKFPKDIVQRKKWLNFCQIDETVINTCTMLCNNHFKDEDFIIRGGDKFKILKNGSLPCRYRSGKSKKRLCQDIIDVHSNSNDNSKENPELLKEEINVGTIPKTAIIQTPEKLISLHSNNSCNESSEDLKLIKEEIDIELAHLDGNKSLEAISLPEDNGENNIFPVIKESLAMTARERLIRYVGDINSSHLMTPKGAEMALNVALKTISQQRRKIKTLQQSSNRLRQKLKSFKDVVQQLQEKNLISGNAAKVLMVFSRRL